MSTGLVAPRARYSARKARISVLPDPATPRIIRCPSPRLRAICSWCISMTASVRSDGSGAGASSSGKAICRMRISGKSSARSRSNCGMDSGSPMRCETMRHNLERNSSGSAPSVISSLNTHRCSAHLLEIGLVELPARDIREYGPEAERKDGFAHEAVTGRKRQGKRQGKRQDKGHLRAIRSR